MSHTGICYHLPHYFLDNDSSHLFLDPFHDAYDALVAEGADNAPGCSSAPRSSRQVQTEGFLILCLDSRLIDNTTRYPSQDHQSCHAAIQAGYLVHCKCNHDDVSSLSAILANNPSLNARTQLVAPTATKGQHGHFDIPPSITVKHQPTAFLTSPLPYGTDGMSSHQQAQYSSLLLGLPLPSLPTPEGLCNCRAPYLLLATINSIVPSGLGAPGRKSNSGRGPLFVLEFRG